MPWCLFDGQFALTDKLPDHLIGIRLEPLAIEPQSLVVPVGSVAGMGIAETQDMGLGDRVGDHLTSYTQ